MKININNSYINLILLFPLFTLFQSYIGPINKILFILLMTVQMTMYLRRGISARFFALLSIVMLMECIELFSTSFPLQSINDIFYFPFIVIFYNFICENGAFFYDLAVKNIKSIKRIIYLWSFFIVVSIAFPLSYTQVWGGGTYFASFTGDPFRLCPTAFYILALILMVMMIEKNRKMFWFSIIPMFCFFSSGSRTYLLVGLLLFLIVWYKFFYNKHMFCLSLLPLVLLFLVFLVNSSMMQKIAATSYSSNSYFDLWGTVTSGRSIFWEADINAFRNGSLWNKLLGFGFNFVYEVNKTAIGAKIWAHNDFIQLLLTYGVLGILLYLKVIYSLFRRRLWKMSEKKWVVYLVFFIWFFTANMNMFYTYLCTVLGYVFLIESLTKIKQTDEEK